MVLRREHYRSDSRVALLLSLILLIVVAVVYFQSDSTPTGAATGSPLSEGDIFDIIYGNDTPEPSDEYGVLDTCGTACNSFTEVIGGCDSTGNGAPNMPYCSPISPTCSGSAWSGCTDICDSGTTYGDCLRCCEQGSTGVCAPGRVTVEVKYTTTTCGTTSCSAPNTAGSCSNTCGGAGVCTPCTPSCSCDPGWSNCDGDISGTGCETAGDNCAPQAHNVTLNATDHPLNTSDANLTLTFVNVTDENGDNITYWYRWMKDGSLNATTLIDNGLVSYWPFNNDTYDYKLANDTVATGSSFLTIGKVGGAYEFDGDGSDYASRTESDYQISSQEGTVAAWIKTTSSAKGTVFSSINNANHDWLIIFGVNSDGRLYIYQEDNDASAPIYSTNTVNDGGWHHVVYVSNGTKYFAYIDGDAETLTGINDGDWFADTSNRNNIVIGATVEISSFDLFNGTIDEVMVFDRPLNASEIKQLYYGSKYGGEVMGSERTGAPGETWSVNVSGCDAGNTFGNWVESNGVTIQAAPVTYPYVTLISPPNGFLSVPNDITLSCNASSDTQLTNLSFYNNLSGVFDRSESYWYYDDGPMNTNGLLAYWALNEASWSGVPGEVKDYIGGHNGTASGDADTASGFINRGGYFDGDGDYVVIPDSPELSGGTGKSFTWMFWVNTGKSGKQGILRKDANSCNKDWIFTILDDGKLHWDYENGCSNQGPDLYTRVLDLNTWYFVAVTFNGADRRATMYLDAEFQKTGITNYNLPDTSAAIRIGTRQYESYRYFDGKIDEILIYNRVLSASEIEAEYHRRAAAMNVTETSELTDLPNGDYLWNCLVYDNLSRSDWNDQNRTFTIGATANLDIWDETETALKGVGESVQFSANYTNITDDSPINGATCTIRFADSTNAMGASGDIYAYSRTFSSAGSHVYNVTCGEASFESIVKVEIASIASNVPPVVDSVDLTTTRPLTNDTHQDLISSISAHDNENDNITFRYNWYKGGTLKATSLISDSLIGYWPLNNDTYDYWSAYDGTPCRYVSVSETCNDTGVPASIPGVVGGGSSFDGSNYMIRGFDPRWNFGTDSFSVAAWFKTSASGWFYSITGFGSGSGDGGWSLGINDFNRLQFFAYDEYMTGGLLTNYNAYTTTPYNDGNWHQAVGVRDTASNTLTLYVDGVVAPNIESPTYNPKTIPAGVDVNTDDPNSRLGIGISGYVGYRWNGSIDEVMVLNKALTASEVKMLYDGSRYGGDVMDSSQTTLGDVWRLDVAGGDYLDFGDWESSNNVTILQNPLPNVTQVNLTTTNPSTNNTNQNLTTSVAAIDYEGDPFTLWYQWYKNNTPILVTGPGVSSNLVSYYRFEENVDDYMGINNGTLYSGAYINTTSGKYDGAISFDGVDDYATIGDPAASSGTSVSWSLWAYPLAQLDGNAGLVCKRVTTGNQEFCIFINSIGGGQYRVYLLRWDSSNNIVISNINAAPIYEDEWNHIVWTESPTETKIYLNNVLKTTYPHSSYSPKNSASPIQLGHNLVIGDRYFTGSLDEVMLFSKVLSAAEVDTLYNVGRSTDSQISSDLTTAGDVWYTNVSARDGDGLFGNWLESNEVTILGEEPSTAPNVTSVNLTTTNPATNDTNQNLTSSIGVTSPLGNDITLAYNWYKDNNLNATTLIEDGLVAYWPLNNDTLDYFGSNDGTIGFQSLNGAEDSTDMVGYQLTASYSTNKKEGTYSTQITYPANDNTYKGFISYKDYGDISPYVLDNSYLQFWMYLEDASEITFGQVELGNTQDAAEYYWINSDMQANNLQDGWNLISLRFGDATQGPVNWATGVDHFRMYLKSTGSNSAIILRLDDLKIVTRPNRVSGKVGGAYEFDEDYIEVPDETSLDLTDAITVSTWVYGNEYESNDMIMHRGAAYGMWFDWGGSALDDNEIQFMIYDGGTWRVCDSDFTPNTGEWYLFTATYDRFDQQCKFYVNGELEKTSSYNQAINNGGGHRIGGWNAGDYFFNGTIDEMMVLNRALNATEIQMLYYGSKYGGDTMGSERTAPGENWSVNVSGGDSLEWGNWVSSNNVTIQLGANVSVQIKTLQDTYSDGEQVNLTDPPDGWVTVFIDDFNDGSIDTNKWTVNYNGGSVVESGGTLQLSSGVTTFPTVLVKTTLPRSKQIRTILFMQYTGVDWLGNGYNFVGGCGEIIGNIWTLGPPSSNTIFYQTYPGGVYSGAAHQRTLSPGTNYYDYAFQRFNDVYQMNNPWSNYQYSTTYSGCSLPSQNPGASFGNADTAGSAQWCSFNIDHIQVDCYATTEICDGWDNDCDGNVDEGCDDDNDDYCDSLMTRSGTPPTCTSGGNDCDDTNAAINPGAAEACDGIDNNCVNGIDEGCACTPPGATQQCGTTDVSECQYGTQTCVAGNWGACVGNIEPEAETCDYLDNDCDGIIDNGCKTTPEEDQSFILADANVTVYTDLAIDYFNETSLSWIFDWNVTERYPINLIEDVKFGLDRIWNNLTLTNGFNTADRSHGYGKYRARVDVYDSPSSTLINGSSYNFTIRAGLPPIATYAILNATDHPLNTTNANLTVYPTVYDLDEDNITLWYKWFKDGVLNATTLIDEGLIAYYPFDNDFYDYYGGNDGIEQGGGVLLNTSGGKVGGAYEFDGINYSKVAIGTPLGTAATEFSALFWFKGIEDQPANTIPFITNKGPGAWTNGEWGIQYYWPTDTTYLQYRPLPSGPHYQVPYVNKVLDGKWHQMAMVVGSSEVILYLDGADVASTPISGVGGMLGNTVYIAGDGYPNPSFNGTLDEVMIFNRSLSATEIQMLYYGSKYGGDVMGYERTAPGETWKVNVSGGDAGNTFGNWVSSNNVTILEEPNTPPTAHNVTLNATDHPLNTTNANLTLYWNATDVDNDSIKNITNWYVDGQSITVLNMPFEANMSKDYSPYENNGTNNGATWNATGGYDGKGAYEFDGVDTKIDLGQGIIDIVNSIDDTGVTISAWIKPEYPGYYAYNPIFYIEDSDSSPRVRFFLFDGASKTIAFNVMDDSGNNLQAQYDSSSAFTYGNWHHVVGWFNKTTVKTYINGAELDSVSGNIGTISQFSLDDNPALGYKKSDSDFFNGAIDDVQIFNRALSAEQIKALYNNRTDLIVSQETKVGETWYAEVTPNDGTEDGIIRTSNNLVVSLAGSGTSGDPFNITSCEELQAMELNLTAYYQLVNDIDCSETTGWNSGDGFNPVGDDSVQFTGNFDGMNHTISELFINRSAEDYVGLFGESNADISDFGLIDVNISGRNYTGALIGEATSGADIDRVYSTGKIIGQDYTGGLIGWNVRGVINNTYSTANVMGNNNVGGLLGSHRQARLYNSYSIGNVSGNENVGGLIGLYDAGIIVSSVFSVGDTFGITDVGGLIGDHTGIGSVINAYWNNHSGNADNCIAVGTGNDGCTAIQDNEDYFKEQVYPCKEPMASWDFYDIWQEQYDDYPVLTWQDIGTNITYPCAPSVTLTTTNPSTNSTIENLTGSAVALDENGDNITYWYNWYKDDVLNATTLITDGLVAYYPLNNDTDDYYGSNDGIANSVSLGDNYGVVGYGGDFYASGSDITLPTSLNSNLDDFTFSMWINSDDSSQLWNTLIGAGFFGSFQWLLNSATYPKKLVLYESGISLISVTDNIFYPDTWYHVAETKSGTTYKLYVNGIELDSDVYAGDLSWANTIYIGQDYTSGRNFKGPIDEVMIFNRSLNASEIKQLYEGSRLGGNKLSNELTTAGDVWKLGVRGGDAGNTFGNWVSSNEVTILQVPYPSAMLVSPADDYLSINIDSITLTCNATSDTNLTNLTFYANTTGGWQANRTFYYSDDSLLDSTSLVGYWKFDNDSLDSSGNALHGSTAGNVQNDTGVVLGAYAFDGASEVSVPDDSDLDLTDDITVSLWLKKDDTPVLGTSSYPGISCLQILQNGASTGDGAYWIDPDGGSSSNKYQVYCDMTTDGGGWTRVMSLDTRSAAGVAPSLTQGIDSSSSYGAYNALTHKNSGFWLLSGDTMGTLSRTDGTDVIRTRIKSDNMTWHYIVNHNRGISTPGEVIQHASIAYDIGNVSGYYTLQPGTTESRYNHFDIGLPHYDPYGTGMAHYGIDILSSVWSGKSGWSASTMSRCCVLQTYSSVRNCGSGEDNLVRLYVREEEGYPAIFDKSGAYGIKLGTGLLTAQINGDSIANVSLGNSWKHVTFTYDDDLGSDNAKIYINGLLAATGNLTDAIVTNANDLIIGEYFEGLIDEVMLFNRVLTDEEILQESHRRGVSNYTEESILLIGLANGEYRWNCLVYDNNSDSDWNDQNWTFTIASKASLDIWDDTDLEWKYVGEDVTFYANFTNTTDGSHVSGECNITVDGGTYAMSEGAGIYTYTKSFPSQGTYDYNVTCNASGYGNITASDSAMIRINNAPNVLEVNLTTTNTARNDSNQNLTSAVSATDLDGDNLTYWYTWYKDNSSGGFIDGTTLINEGLVSYWPLNNDSYDYKGDYDGINNGTTLTTSGKIGGAYVFDGVDSNIEVPSFTLAADNFSFSLWFYMKDNATTRGTRISLLYSDYGFVVYQHNANDYIYFHRLGQRYIEWIPTLNEWHHLSCSVGFGGNATDTYEAECYADGVSKPMYQFGYFNPATNLKIGGANAGNSVNGSVDEVMIFNRSLTASEIQQLYYGSKYGGAELGAERTRAGDNWTLGVKAGDYALWSAEEFSYPSLEIEQAPQIEVYIKTTEDIYTDSQLVNLTSPPTACSTHCTHSGTGSPSCDCGTSTTCGCVTGRSQGSGYCWDCDDDYGYGVPSGANGQCWTNTGGWLYDNGNVIATGVQVSNPACCPGGGDHWCNTPGDSYCDAGETPAGSPTDCPKSYVVSDIDTSVWLDLTVEYWTGSAWAFDWNVTTEYQVDLTAGVGFDLETVWDSLAESNGFNTDNKSHGYAPYRATVYVYDSPFSVLLNSSSYNFTILGNTAPNTTLVVLNTSSGNDFSNESLSCYANITDYEHSTVFANYTWYNGSSVYSSGQTSVSSNTVSWISSIGPDKTGVGETWTCSVQAYDGLLYEGDWNNASLTIIGRPGFDDCGLLDEENRTYTLELDILDHVGTCFTITADNVILDGQGHLIDGDDIDEDYGVYSLYHTNLTIRNLNVTEFGNTTQGAGIYLSHVNDSLVEFVSTSSNYMGMVFFASSYRNRILNNTASENSHSGIYIHTCSDTDIINNTAENNSGNIQSSGVMLHGCSDARIFNNQVNNNENTGVHLYGACNNVIVADNEIHETVTGISIHDGYDNLIANNTIEDTVTGILGYANPINTTVFNNTVYNSTTSGISVHGDSSNVSFNRVVNSLYGISFNIHDYTVFNNTIDNATGNGIWLQPNSYDSEVYGNRVLNSGTGINIYRCENNSVFNNSIRDNNRGISVEGALGDESYNNTIEENLILDSLAGITISSESIDNSIINNRIVGSTNGIQISTSSNNFIGNDIINSSNNGLRITGGAYNLLENNIIHNSSIYGISLEVANPSNNTFRNVTVTLSGTRDVNMVANCHGNYFIDSFFDTYAFANNRVWFKETDVADLRFLGNISGSGTHLNDANANEIINLADNLAEVRTDLAAGFDAPANITLYGIGDRGFVHPDVLRDGYVCMDCVNFTSLLAENVTFNVTGFSEYEIGEAVFQPIDVDGCGELNESGYYQLTQDIGDNETCLIITNDDVTLDCDGYIVQGNDTVDTYGVIANGLTNITVANCTFMDWDIGIYYNNTDAGLIYNNTAESNINHGTLLYLGSNGNYVLNNTFNDNNAGIVVSLSDNNVIDNNTIHDNTQTGVGISGSYNNVTNNSIRGSGVHGVSMWVGSQHNLISGNTFGANSESVVIVQTSNNTVVDNYFYAGVGVDIYGSSYNTVARNNFTNTLGIAIVEYLGSNSTNNFIANNTIVNSTYGIRLSSASNNTIFNNTIEDHDDYGIYFNANSMDNILNNNQICFNTGDDILDADNNSGDNNTCDTGNWSDDNTTGCTYFCTEISLIKSVDITDTFPDTTVNWTINITNEGLRTVNITLNDTNGMNFTIVNLAAGANWTTNYTTITPCETFNNTVNASAENVFTLFFTQASQEVNITACGDGVCNCDEACGTCEQDCGTCYTPHMETVIITPPSTTELPEPEPEPEPEKPGSEVFIIPDIREMIVLTDNNYNVGDRLYVEIFDEDGNPIVAELTLTRPDGTTIVIMSDQEFIIDMAGAWHIKAEKPGFKEGETDTFAIEPAPQGMGAQISKAIDEVLDYFAKNPLGFALLLVTVVLLVTVPIYLKRKKKSSMEKF